MNRKNLDKLVSDSLAMEAAAAKEAGALGYMARVLTQATLPHKRVQGSEFTRRNGLFTLSILSPERTGLPYGTIPRLLLSWMTTEAVKTKSPELVLGQTLSGFMRELGLIPAGGRWGTITRLRDQMQRLFSAAISCTYDNGAHWAIHNIQPVSRASLWWDPKLPEQPSIWQSTITLGKDFFEEIINRPIPIDLRALKTLKRSPLALDIYCWLTYRMSYLKHKTIIPWNALQMQFGADYALDSQGARNFKKAFLRELRKVTLFYPDVNLSEEIGGLQLAPSKSHILPKT